MYRQNGFTLLELLITLAVITVLGVIAVTSYSGYLVRGYRVDAKSALTRLAQQEERYFSAHHTYLGGNAAVKQFHDPKAEGDSIPSEKGLYKIKATAGKTTYTLTATPVDGKPAAARDKKCREFTLDHTGKEAARGFKEGAEGLVDMTSECWGR